jgi:hypothetical protein
MRCSGGNLEEERHAKATYYIWNWTNTWFDEFLLLEEEEVIVERIIMAVHRAFYRLDIVPSLLAKKISSLLLLIFLERTAHRFEDLKLRAIAQSRH